MFSTFKQIFSRIFDADKNSIRVIVANNNLTEIISFFYNKNFLYKNNILQIRNISDDGIDYLNAIYLVNFSDISNVCDAVQSKKYRQFYIYFFDPLKEKHLSDIASYDKHELIKDICDVTINYIPLDDFTFNYYNYNADDIIAICKDMKIAPKVDGNIVMVSQLKKEIDKFSKYHNKNSIIILMERESDLVAPLLLERSYIGMIEKYTSHKITNYLFEDINKYADFYKVCEQIATMRKENEKSLKNDASKDLIFNVEDYLKKSETLKIHQKIIEDIYEKIKPLKNLYFQESQIIDGKTIDTDNETLKELQKIINKEKNWLGEYEPQVQKLLSKVKNTTFDIIIIWINGKLTNFERRLVYDFGDKRIYICGKA